MTVTSSAAQHNNNTRQSSNPTPRQHKKDNTSSPPSTNPQSAAVTAPGRSCLKTSSSKPAMCPANTTTTPMNSSRRRRGPNNDARRTGGGPDDSGVFADIPGAGTSTCVNFTVVEIREFERVVGDNPSCSSGVPVSIGWKHGKTFTMNLEDFERARPPRRSQLDLVLSRGERHRLLVEWGASGQDVIEAIRMIIRVKNQRRQTVNNLGSYDRIEEVFERMMRTAMRAICHSSSDTAARRLQEESERAATVRKLEKKAVSQATSCTVAESTTAEASSGPQETKTRIPPASTATKVPTRGDGRCNSKPPSVVNVMNHDDSGSNNSDMGDKALSSDELPEDSFGNNSVHVVELVDIHDVISKHHQERSDRDLDDDLVDDMSNPQSHEHRGNRPKKSTTTAAVPLVEADRQTTVDA